MLQQQPHAAFQQRIASMIPMVMKVYGCYSVLNLACTCPGCLCTPYLLSLLGHARRGHAACELIAVLRSLSCAVVGHQLVAPALGPAQWEQQRQ
jgi:hypothetical protein